MTTHVFIVDTTTFGIHLEYLFAGTGGRDFSVDFNNRRQSCIHHSRENLLVGMIADASRIRKGDMVVFYLQQNASANIAEGKFYGIFKTTENWSFLDNNDSRQYLGNELRKSLTFRTLLEPYRVYPEGVTEWEALDEIRCIQSPCQMLWSLIYRKLKGNRGNTMITIYESERLCQLIRRKNNQNTVETENGKLSFDRDGQRIICLDSPRNEYAGRREEINILPRLSDKFGNNQAFEVHLQAYIVKNIGGGINNPLDAAVLGNGKIEWIGNEVSCGVGMQRIDIMLSVVEDGQKICIPIELKAVEAKPENTVQIQRYVDWIEQYYLPNRQSDIQPVLLAKKIAHKTSLQYREIIRSFESFNRRNPGCNKLKYIEFDLVGGNLLFNEIEY